MSLPFASATWKDIYSDGSVPKTAVPDTLFVTELHGVHQSIPDDDQEVVIIKFCQQPCRTAISQ